MVSATGDGYGHGHTALDRYGNKTYDRGAFEKHGSQNYTDSKGVTIYDRRTRSAHSVKGIEGGVNLRGDYYRNKKPGIIGHSTQYFEDGYHVSRETRDGMNEENVHWTNQKVEKGNPDRHKKPDDTH